MEFSDQTTTNLNSSATPPPASYTAQRTRKPRSTGCAILFFIVAFLVGVIVTLAGVFSYIVFFSSGNTHPATSTSSSAAGAILVETKTAYMSQVVQKNMNASSIPGGQLSDAQVSFTHNGPMVITANIQFSILGISTTRQLTLALQPSIVSCQLHMSVVQADLQGFPITVFVQSFESQINSQMQMTATGLPPGFKYCVTNVHTEPDGLYLTYSATPT
jgi:hypothetical protein